MNGRIIRMEQQHHIHDAVKLAQALWEKESGRELYDEFKSYPESTKDAVFLYIADDTPAGFIHMSLREEYVEGTHSSPVGYVEGIYVKTEFRKRSVARELLEAGEKWAAGKGCSEIASDAEAENTLSLKFHEATGFREVNRLVCFVKTIGGENG